MVPERVLSQSDSHLVTIKLTGLSQAAETEMQKGRAWNYRDAWIVRSQAV
jgi:hypothetical protein